jgi:hypothetical protein
MKEIKYTILYCVIVRNFVIPIYYGSGIVINCGSCPYSNSLTSYGSGFGSGSTRQKVTFPVPVPQHCPKLWTLSRVSYHPPFISRHLGIASLRSVKMK